MKKISSFCEYGKCCVEVDILDGDTIIVSDSKDPDGAPLQFDREEWDAFLKGIKAGEFDAS